MTLIQPAKSLLEGPKIKIYKNNHDWYTCVAEVNNHDWYTCAAEVGFWTCTEFSASKKIRSDQSTIYIHLALPSILQTFQNFEFKKKNQNSISKKLWKMGIQVTPVIPKQWHLCTKWERFCYLSHAQHRPLLVLKKLIPSIRKVHQKTMTETRGKHRILFFEKIGLQERFISPKP